MFQMSGSGIWLGTLGSFSFGLKFGVITFGRLNGSEIKQTGSYRSRVEMCFYFSFLSFGQDFHNYEIWRSWSNRSWCHLYASQIKKKLTFIDGSSTETVRLMFLELFDWDYMTSIIFAVSHLFSYLWIFLKGKVLIKWLLSFACIPPSIHFWKCWRHTMFQH